VGAEDRDEDVVGATPDSDATATSEGSGAATGYRVAAAIPDPTTTKRYERGPEIARGGLGRVMSALDRTLQRKVAIKELHERTEHGRRRFVREGLTTARLQHPAIVPVLDAGTWEGGDPFLVMKLLEGSTLSEELSERRTTDARLALIPNLLAVADALGYAHEQGIVHRDVKPSNIMIGTHGETVLLDWGIAHDASATALETDGWGRGPEPTADGSTEESLTVVGSVTGTVRYMSPEQARGEPATPAFDVYSLGVTIASVLAGERPFDALDHDDIVARVRAGDTEIPTLPPEVPADLAAIVAKATAPVGERCSHAGLIADDLRKFIAGKLVSARHYTLRQLVARWIRRHRLLLAIVGVATAVVIAVGVVAVRSVVHERNRAVTERAAAETRERELVLLQARSNLRTDPTATLAWLARYPTTAPRQDEVLAMVDEAEGRGVARHVFRPASRTRDAVWLPEGSLISGHQDGSLLRTDAARGDQRQAAALARSVVFVRAVGSAVVALDQGGGLHRWTPGGVTDLATLPLRSRVTGMWSVPGTDELKLTFSADEAELVSATVPGGWRHQDLDAAALHAATFDDDENTATIVFAVAADGTLTALAPKAPPRRLWKFAPRTWVRSSDDGRTYAAIEPTDDTTMTLWIGTADGGPPTAFATTRACAPGEDREESGEVSNDGRFAAIQRCGVMLLYDVEARRAIALRDPERVGEFLWSPDQRWLSLGRGDAVDLVDLESGEVRRLAGGSRIAFSRSGDWYATFGADGIRLWPRDRVVLPPGGLLGTRERIANPTRLYLPAGDGELAVRQHFTCAAWRLADRTRLVGFGVPAAAIEYIDDEALLWAWDSSDDGRTCIFASPDGSAIAARADGSTRTLAADHALTACAVTADGGHALCIAEQTLVGFDLGGTSPPTRRAVDGKPRGLARYRGALVILVDLGHRCELQDPDGARLAELPAGCLGLRASNGHQLGRDAALVIRRAGAVDVWIEGAEHRTISTESGLVEVAPARDLVAIAHDRVVDVFDLDTCTLRSARTGHALAVDGLAWSSTGILASHDGETVRLWDPVADRTRVIYAGHVISIVWARDGRSIVTTDGRVFRSWPVDLAHGASPTEVRDRIEHLTSARIVDGVVATPR